MISMTRNEEAGSNTRPANVITFGNVPSYKYYEQVYFTIGPQEWITLPDAGQSKVVVTFPTGTGSAMLEGTASPPDMCYNPSQGSLSPLNYRGPFSPATYPIVDTITEPTGVIIQGDTAIRLNIIGAPAAISVRC
jgi:hypothetical protein